MQVDVADLGTSELYKTHPKAQSSPQPCLTPFQARGPPLATSLDSRYNTKTQL